MDLAHDSIWLPYIQFSDFHDTIGIHDNLKIFPDIPSVWRDLNLTRPRWFNIFRQFPAVKKGRRLGAQPCSGSIISAGGPLLESRWLSRHAARLVAILYFIGDKAVGFGTSHYGGNPKELFTFLPFSGNNLGVVFTTKYGRAYEEKISLGITPPLTLRVIRNDIYRLDLDRSLNKKLLSVLFDNPDHHIITACLYYFYAQSGELFNNNPYLDTIFLCGALEAAFNIKEKGKRKEILVEYLMGEYCSNIPSSTTHWQRYKEFFDGLYDFRSIGAHGIPIPEASVSAPDMKAYKNFYKLKGRFSIIRAITRDIIIRNIKRLPNYNDGEYFYDDDASNLLHASLYASDIWMRIKHYANIPKSIVTLANPDPAFHDKFNAETRDFCHIFRIELLDDIPDKTEIMKYYTVYIHALFMRATALDESISIHPKDVIPDDKRNILQHLGKIDRYGDDALIRRLYGIVDKFMEILNFYVFRTKT